jgi:hypothetical protein
VLQKLLTATTNPGAFQVLMFSNAQQRAADSTGARLVGRTVMLCPGGGGT